MQKIVCRQQLLPILPQLQPEREGCIRGYGQRIHPSKPPWKPGSLTVTGSGQVGIVLPGGTGGGVLRERTSGGTESQQVAKRGTI